jgi:hypothetical protein
LKKKQYFDNLGIIVLKKKNNIMLARYHGELSSGSTWRISPKLAPCLTKVSNKTMKGLT